MDPIDRNTLSVDEIESMKSAQKLLTMKRSDIEKYLTSYRFFKANGEGTASGDTTVFDVELDKDNIVSFVETLTKDFAGTGMTAEEKENMRTDLE